MGRVGQKRWRRFLFTMNSPVPDDLATLKELTTSVKEFDHYNLRYLVCQEEKGEETGRTHIQGYCELLKPKKLGGIRTMFGRSVHVSHVNYPKKAIAYCKKKKTRVNDGFSAEYGTPAKSTKKMVDHGGFNISISDAIARGATKAHIIEHYPTKYMQHATNIEKMIAHYMPKRDFKPEIEIYFGPTGSGKSYTAHKLYHDAFWIKWPDKSNWWWDGYEGQEVVVLDEFRHQIKLDVMLNLFDCYPFKVEPKYGMTEFRSKKIVVTTNIEPMNWYPKVRDVSMLLRRFKDFAKIYVFDDLGDKDVEDISYTHRLVQPVRDHFGFALSGSQSVSPINNSQEFPR